MLLPFPAGAQRPVGRDVPATFKGDHRCQPPAKSPLHGNPEENSAYLTILEEQAKNEGRILELKGLLETARVGQSPPDNGIVEMGMVVDVTVADQDIRFLFGNRQISKDNDGLDVYSQHSPLGVAIHGVKVGETVTYIAPNGKSMTVTINSATPYES